MELRLYKHHASQDGEEGFTLPEVLITVVLIGIVMAIASSSWLGVVESRAVDSATNQLVADLRLAHSTATNRLTPWEVSLSANSSTYTVGPTGAPQARTLPEDVKTSDAATYTFNADGSVSTASPTAFAVTKDGDPSHNIELNTATSRVKIDP
jgi:type IV fimbrial biogenesis protein FimT